MLVIVDAPSAFQQLLKLIVLYPKRHLQLFGFELFHVAVPRLPGVHTLSRDVEPTHKGGHFRLGLVCLGNNDHPSFAVTLLQQTGAILVKLSENLSLVSVILTEKTGMVTKPFRVGEKTL